MSTVNYRIDYAKFLITCAPENWHHYYSELNRESHEMKCSGEWLKSHKVNRLWYNADAGLETWSVDIWGEWAIIVDRLPINWVECLKRLDVRATIWDADKDTILNIGQHLQRHVTSHNINVFSTKPASKRLGRDRGGVGFAIGSHKSDLRITTYKRTGEPVAQEFQCSGAMLDRLRNDLLSKYANVWQTYSIWVGLKHMIEAEGQKRLARVMESAGIGTYWPVLGPADLPALPPIQSGFIPELTDEIADMIEDSHAED